MKIIQLILGKGNPERMNGVNKVVNSLAHTMHTLGEDIEVWGITPEIASGKQHATPFTTRLYAAMPKSFQLAPQLIADIKQCSKTTVFHLHGAFIPEFYSAAKLLSKHNIPFIFTPHGAYNKYALQKSFFKKLLYYTLFERTLLSKTAHLHLLGRNERSYITQLTSEKKIIVIPNGQHLTASPCLAHKESNDLVFGFMGRIDIRHKGLDFMLQGFAQYVHELKGNGKLWLLGDGDDMKVVKEEIKRLNIEKRCTVYGSQFGDEKVKLMQQFDVFLHTSRYEGIPMAVLESALMGIPCIVSQATNVKEEVESYQAGIGLIDTDADTIARALLKMQSNKQRGRINEMKKNAIKMVQNEYDWVKITQKFIGTYEQLV